MHLFLCFSTFPSSSLVYFFLLKISGIFLVIFPLLLFGLLFLLCSFWSQSQLITWLSELLLRLVSCFNHVQSKLLGQDPLAPEVATSTAFLVVRKASDSSDVGRCTHEGLTLLVTSLIIVWCGLVCSIFVCILHWREPQNLRLQPDSH